MTPISRTSCSSRKPQSLKPCLQVCLNRQYLFFLTFFLGYLKIQKNFMILKCYMNTVKYKKVDESFNMFFVPNIEKQVISLYVYLCIYKIHILMCMLYIYIFLYVCIYYTYIHLYAHIHINLPLDCVYICAKKPTGRYIFHKCKPLPYSFYYQEDIEHISLRKIRDCMTSQHRGDLLIPSYPF